MNKRKKILTILIIAIAIVILILFLYFNFKPSVKYEGNQYSPSMGYLASYYAYYNDSWPVCSSETSVKLLKKNDSKSTEVEIFRLIYPTSLQLNWKSDKNLDIVLPSQEKVYLKHPEYTNNLEKKYFNDMVLKYLPKFGDIEVTINGEKFEKFDPVSPNDDDCVFLDLEEFKVQ